MKKALALSRHNLHLAPVQPAAGRRQRSMPAQGLGCQTPQWEQSRQVEARRFPTRFGYSGTLAGAAGRAAFMKYAG